MRARSSLARPGVKVAPLRALKKLKACLCTSTQEEKLPLFQLPSLDYRRGMDVIAKVLRMPAPSFESMEGLSAPHINLTRAPARS